MGGVKALAFATVVLIFLADSSTPETVSFAPLSAVPVAILAWLPGSAYRWLLLTALLLAALTVRLGGLSLESAATVAVACAGIAAVVRLARRPVAPQAEANFPNVIELLAEDQASKAGRTEAALAGIGLTRRERDVVRLAVQGLTVREIGTRLFIGERTVETHLTNSYAKLGVGSKRELIARIVPQPD